MASIESSRQVITQRKSPHEVSFTVNYPEAPDPETPYWHVFQQWDTEVIGNVQEPAHVLGIIRESCYAVLPEEHLPPGAEFLKTFDHDPTEEELEDLLPPEYKES